MKDCINVVECIIKLDERYLVIKKPDGVHAGGLLSFPGGKVEFEDGTNAPTDILRCAVKREVFEEVGLRLIDEIRYLNSSYFKR